MRSYKLSNGYIVQTRAHSSGDTEFTTLNPAGETISTKVLGGEAAREVFIGLRVATCLGARA
jgi:hypothetical protein